MRAKAIWNIWTRIKWEAKLKNIIIFCFFLFIGNNIATRGVANQTKTIKLVWDSDFFFLMNILFFCSGLRTQNHRGWWRWWERRWWRWRTMVQRHRWRHRGWRRWWRWRCRRTALTGSRWWRGIEEVGLDPLVQCATCLHILLACLQGGCSCSECCSD